MWKTSCPWHFIYCHYFPIHLCISVHHFLSVVSSLWCSCPFLVNFSALSFPFNSWSPCASLLIYFAFFWVTIDCELNQIVFSFFLRPVRMYLSLNVSILSTNFLLCKSSVISCFTGYKIYGTFSLTSVIIQKKTSSLTRSFRQYVGEKRNDWGMLSF